MSLIYLDHQATTPPDEAVLAAMNEANTRLFANPASPHAAGLRVFSEVERVRDLIARFLDVRKTEIYFTSGATEANNLAIKGIAAEHPGGHVLTSAVEHKSVLDTCRSLEQAGHPLTVLPVDEQGRVRPEDVAAHLRPDTILVSIMLANNEIGTIQPIREIAQITREASVPLHCDATQGMGYLPTRAPDLGVDLLTFSGHKIYGPKGVGVLFAANDLTDRSPLRRLLHGGAQERGLRAGTLNTPAILGLGAAVGLLDHRAASQLTNLRARLLNELAGGGARFECNSGTDAGFLPHAVNLSFTGVDAQQLLLDLTDVAVSSGSACNSSSQEPSHVLRAIGLSDERIKSSIRLSIGRSTTEADIVQAAASLTAAVARCRR
ncbi:cysteine desulfurase [Saccharopolyspora erythraea NRRL 2338]|uniref:cysteine desulfurase n=3 Tax=Saccharopolyspora erythraea TaxID=1836 RepID=A4FCX5_SACEN|nr:cysteine desulfurase [Saccharopolyspora erythraea D]PFG95649.1 cysteine desulfurase [Saccharopolyspora erythraea NRRL 2338]QRK93520.1 cysteine desulfurase [Saccharopolyspora erythraea]CAM01900.1 cysteine desulfurase [Saccharopolyspora erythraea NRRL 2338]